MLAPVAVDVNAVTARMIFPGGSASIHRFGFWLAVCDLGRELLGRFAVQGVLVLPVCRFLQGPRVVGGW